MTVQIGRRRMGFAGSDIVILAALILVSLGLENAILKNVA